MTTKPNALPWLLLSALVIALDQLSKWWALAALQPAGMPHPVIPGLLNWTLAFNPGAAFLYYAWLQQWPTALLAQHVARRRHRAAFPLACDHAVAG